jgi:hypothetical protein
MLHCVNPEERMAIPPDAHAGGSASSARRVPKRI